MAHPTSLGGFTYCSIACYHLSSRLPFLPNSAKHLRWLVDRQVRPPPRNAEVESDDEEEDSKEDSVQGEQKEMAGFQGRSGKDTDACYSFWITAALRVRLHFLFISILDLLTPRLPHSYCAPTSRSSNLSLINGGYSNVSTRCTAALPGNRELYQVRRSLTFRILSFLGAHSPTALPHT